MTTPTPKVRTIIVRLLICFCGLFLIGFKLWTNKYFGNISIDQVLSTIAFDVQGTLTGDPAFTRRFLQWCVYWPFIVTIMVYVVTPNQFSKYIARLLLITGIALVCQQYQIITYIKQHTGKQHDYFAAQYIDPAKIYIYATHPKNLVLIYVESLESTYSDTRLFQHDLLASLNNLPANHLTFKQYEQVPGTEWSVAGIIATQCAVPFKLLTILKQNKIGETINHMLPDATCLGDILAANGYENVYLNGSDLNFAGVGKFFKDHHYTELVGRAEWMKHTDIPAAAISGWGLHDDLLLDQAKIKLEKLVRSQKHFNLTIFTIDTHGPDGYLNTRCSAKTNAKNFSGIIECTANQIADFVNYAQQKGWLKNMNIVIIGDHLAMKNPVSKKLDAAQQRNIFNMIISENKLQKNTDDIIHFDMLPTILSSLGFEYHGARLGLGYSGIGRSEHTRTAAALAELKEKITLPSKRYNQLWNESEFKTASKTHTPRLVN